MEGYAGFTRVFRVANDEGQEAHVIAENVPAIFRADLIDVALDLEAPPIHITVVPADTKVSIVSEDWLDQHLPESVTVDEDACELTATAQAWADLHGREPLVLCSTEWVP